MAGSEVMTNAAQALLELDGHSVMLPFSIAGDTVFKRGEAVKIDTATKAAAPIALLSEANAVCLEDIDTTGAAVTSAKFLVQGNVALEGLVLPDALAASDTADLFAPLFAAGIFVHDTTYAG